MLGTRNDTVVRVRAHFLQRAMAAIGKKRRKTDERVRLAAAGILPGLSETQRREVYRSQNGGTDRLTPAQQRRLDKKSYQRPEGGTAVHRAIEDGVHADA